MPRAVVFGLTGTRLTADEAAFFRDADPLAFIFFGRNVETPEQLRRLTADLRAAVGRDAMIMIDQEGGRVARLTSPYWTDWQNALEQMHANPSMQAMEMRYRIIGAELRAVGIDVNCAPVLDVARPDTHDILKSRCFGFDADTVAAAGRATADGLLASGVVPVIKHMPGQGLGTVDSHVGLPVVHADSETLQRIDFAPFKALADLPMGMTGHVVYDAIDRTVGTLSPAVIDVIRTKIGFDGLLMTDDLSMHALDGTHASRAVRALAAGCDVILHCSGIAGTMEEIVPEVPILTGKAEERADIAINCRSPQDIVDIRELVAEYGAMMESES